MTDSNTFSRRLRLGIVGGGNRDSIGPSHIAAARLDGRWEVIAGAFSRNHDKTKAVAMGLLVDPERAYSTYSEMVEREIARPDPIDAVTICTYNDTHYEIADAFLSKGIHVICDKPLAISRQQAHALAKKVAEVDRVLAVTYTYSGYPMVRMAREIIAEGRLGSIYSAQIEYASHYQTRAFDEQEPKPFRQATVDGSGVIAALGTHAFHMLEFVSGLQVKELAADLTGPRNAPDDHANVLLRFDGGASGALWTTSIAHGSANGLAFRIYGNKGSLTWHQERPEQLLFCAPREQPVLYSRGDPGASAASRAVTRIPAGHPEGYLEAFANIYTAVARAIAAGRSLPVDGEFPTVTDGARGVGFVSSAQESARAGGSFVPLVV